MKKILLGLLTAVGLFTASEAHAFDLTASYGGFTQMDAMDCHDGGSDVNNAWGALNIGADFKVAPGFTLGPSYSFSSTSRKHFSENKFYYHVLMLNGKYNYYRNSIVTLYGHVGVGSVISHQTYEGDSKNKGYFAFQVSPIGAFVDLTPKIAMFGEAGFGAQGLLQVGVKINL